MVTLHYPQTLILTLRSSLVDRGIARMAFALMIREQQLELDMEQLTGSK